MGVEDLLRAVVRRTPVPEEEELAHSLFPIMLTNTQASVRWFTKTDCLDIPQGRSTSSSASQSMSSRSTASSPVSMAGPTRERGPGMG